MSGKRYEPMDLALQAVGEGDDDWKSASWNELFGDFRRYGFDAPADDVVDAIGLIVDANRAMLEALELMQAAQGAILRSDPDAEDVVDFGNAWALGLQATAKARGTTK